MRKLERIVKEHLDELANDYQDCDIFLDPQVRTRQRKDLNQCAERFICLVEPQEFMRENYRLYYELAKSCGEEHIGL